ncbi:Dolichyl-diphosphooligosaccharide--protein glycosyltransferase subunit Swp1 [Rhizopus microsporus]
MLTSILAGFITTTLFNIAKAAGTEDIFELQPEIHHVFRPNEKMPPVLFSQLFSLIVLSPWLILIFGWLSLGYTPAKVMSDFASFNRSSIYILGFIGSLVAIEYLFYLYWTKLNLMEMLPYFGGLCVITFITGQRALSSIQQKRIK